MKILLVNDDGIEAKGLADLARVSAALGEVWIAAPDKQCSAMSHRLTLGVEKDIMIHPDYPVPVKKAYSISGTPAECVKIALHELLPTPPDIVFSGVNYGWNTGFDIAYSGTVAAALEARMNGIRAAAFSTQAVPCQEVMERDLMAITRELLCKDISDDEIWNVNFPGCALRDYQGELWNRKVARAQLFLDTYQRIEKGNGIISVIEKNIKMREEDIPEGSDLKAVMQNYTSIGKIRSHVL